MLTKAQFKKRWRKMIPMQKKFVLEYIQCFNARDAAIKAGYTGVSIKHPQYRVYRKVSDVCDYLIAQQNLYSKLITKDWILAQFKQLFDNSTSEVSKIQILDRFAKIMQLVEQGKTQVNISNQLPKININFNKEEDPK